MNNQKKKLAIKKRVDKDQLALLEQLKKLPIVQVACERIGISRSTYYRWLESQTFKRTANEAIKFGESFINDMSESQLISLIKEKDFRAVRYWLDRRHPRFKRPPDPQDQNEDDKITYKIIKY